MGEGGEGGGWFLGGEEGGEPALGGVQVFGGCEVGGELLGPGAHFWGVEVVIGFLWESCVVGLKKWEGRGF